MIIYSAGPFWLRALIAFGALVIFLFMARWYYDRFWRR
ncbi:MAG: hypothetical protein QOH89_332 [Pseudonocardiales bacterium]|jgi:hypothetical protein|nr:hypothetical protein [Pseudonocardiales bacterium]MDT4941929.1 hypothetical protein [Pseudonocardiales bacterium]